MCNVLVLCMATRCWTLWVLSPAVADEPGFVCVSSVPPCINHKAGWRRWCNTPLSLVCPSNHGVWVFQSRPPLKLRQPELPE